MLLFGEICANGGLAVYGSRTEARPERGGQATGPYGRSAARHSARGVVMAQKSAEVIVVAPVGGDEGPNIAEQGGAVSGSTTTRNPEGGVEGRRRATRPSLDGDPNGSRYTTRDEPPGADPHARWWGGGGRKARPYPISVRGFMLKRPAVMCGVLALATMSACSVIEAVFLGVDLSVIGWCGDTRRLLCWCEETERRMSPRSLVT
jgi:hypothetical protein